MYLHIEETKTLFEVLVIDMQIFLAYLKVAYEVD